MIARRIKSQMLETLMRTFISTKSVAWNFAKKLPTLGLHYMAITASKLNLPRTFCPTNPTLPKESTQHYTPFSLNADKSNHGCKNILYFRFDKYKRNHAVN